MDPPPPPASNTANPQNLTPDSPAIIDLATRLYDAARAGDVPTLSAALAAGLPPNLTNSEGNTLLMLATYHGRAELARVLLQHGADPNRLNDRGQSCLAGALFKGEDAVVDLLLDHCPVAAANPPGGGGGGGPVAGAAGYADVDAGHPSAWECMALFRKETQWRGKFERQRGKILEARGGGLSDAAGVGAAVTGGGGGRGGPMLEKEKGKEENGVGGVKEGFEMV